MHRRLLGFIRRHQLFTINDPFLVAVSGGVDSVVLTHVLHELGFNFAIAHCNFQLRGEQSEEDEVFVRNLAFSLNRKFFSQRFDTAAYRKSHGISIQMAARDLRRSWFESLMKSWGYSKIVTAHHLNDSIETALYNFTKGTGIAGLQGMPPENGHYVRPLMFATREMIQDYAQKNALLWREDASNATTKYHRNLIRHKVVPVLKQINPGLEETFQATAERIASANRIFQSAMTTYREELLEPYYSGLRVSKAKMMRVVDLPVILHELLSDYGFNYDQSRDIASSLEGQPGKCFFSMNHCLSVDRDYIFLMPQTPCPEGELFVGAEEKKLIVGDQLFTFESFQADNFHLSTNAHMAFLDKDKLAFPLRVRRWEDGDRFQPLGMMQKKKVSDFIIDAKIPLTFKRNIFVVLSGKNIIWVAGHRIDDRYKITASTRNVFRINIQQHHV